jgi:hypothetical protein
LKLLQLLHAWIAGEFYRWAMREINPLHPDVPRIMARQRELQDKMGRLLP